MLTIRTILLAADLEPGSAHAIDYAYALGERLGAVVHAVHAYPPVVVPDGAGSGSIPFEALHDGARQRLIAGVAPHRSSPSMGQCVVDLGEPLTVILDMAAELDADLIVVGTHARQGVQRLLMGSVAEAVLREATVPVLIVRAPGTPAVTAADAAATT